MRLVCPFAEYVLDVPFRDDVVIRGIHQICFTVDKPRIGGQEVEQGARTKIVALFGNLPVFRCRYQAFWLTSYCFMAASRSRRAFFYFNTDTTLVLCERVISALRLVTVAF